MRATGSIIRRAAGSAALSGALVAGFVVAAPATVAQAAGPSVADVSSVETAVAKAVGGGADVVKTASVDAEHAAVATNDAGTVRVPRRGEGTVTVGNGDGSQMGIGLPTAAGKSATTTASGTVVYSSPGARTSVAVQPTSKGVRALVAINDKSAPRDYRFPITLPSGHRIVTAADAAGPAITTGELFILDQDGKTAGGFEAPWAKDTNGKSVPTNYRIEGSTIVQTVNFTGNESFPIVADPSGIWGWTKCIGAVGALVAGNLLIASKVAKAGGAAKVARRLFTAKNAQDRYKAALAFFGEISGIGLVVDKCVNE